jgi:alkylation response protein AidB-like acyl-CoA dehydrogenase
MRTVIAGGQKIRSRRWAPSWPAIDRPSRVALPEPLGAASLSAPAWRQIAREDLKEQISSLAIGFRGCDVTNMGRRTELLEHPVYRRIARTTVESKSAVCSDALGEKVDLVTRVLRHARSDLSTFVHAIEPVGSVARAASAPRIDLRHPAATWGHLFDSEYGGVGVPIATFSRYLIRMATIEPNVAGLASVLGCIGVVDPFRTFGSAEQKERHPSQLAGGEKFSGFALTEPCAGSDLTAVCTQARLDGDEYVIDGEKLFITNAVPGRTVGLVCRIEGKPSVLIVDLPDHENDQFKLVPYGLFALKRLHNNGLKFSGLRVPGKNLLRPPSGDGLTVAYHGLNLSRVALCATAAGTMRVMFANLLPWARFRRTYGAAIVTRELVLRRIGRLAALVVGCDALVDWCSWLLDQGYRGELECIVAKIFGSEVQKAAIELFMRTHGGRAFLRAHLFGANVQECLAPCIYEGEGEMLGVAFFMALIKEHGKTYFEPVGRALRASASRTQQSSHVRRALPVTTNGTAARSWPTGPTIRSGCGTSWRTHLRRCTQFMWVTSRTCSLESSNN